jgi:hypothetical protein|tara:strand:- start:66 stop:851 length:786 start_codon:yes stop_codon:yes gene_type:complete
MSLKYTIYIPSKNRSDNCKTAQILLKHEFKSFKIVIEPQDYKDYLKYYNEDNLLILPKNDMGLGYSRQYTKEYSQSLKEKYHWTMDDDLDFYKRINTLEDGKVKGKNVPVDPIWAFSHIEQYVSEYKNIGQAGLIHQAFAWTKKHDREYNKQCCSCYLNNNETQAQYRCKVKDDTDYSLQVLFEGYTTVNFNRFIYKNPPFGKVKGGLTSEYTNNPNRYDDFLKLWPSFELKKSPNSIHGYTIKPNRIWKTFDQRPIRYGN